MEYINDTLRSLLYKKLVVAKKHETHRTLLTMTRTGVLPEEGECDPVDDLEGIMDLMINLLDEEEDRAFMRDIYVDRISTKEAGEKLGLSQSLASKRSKQNLQVMLEVGMVRYPNEMEIYRDSIGG